MNRDFTAALPVNDNDSIEGGCGKERRDRRLGGGERRPLWLLCTHINKYVNESI